MLVVSLLFSDEWVLLFFIRIAFPEKCSLIHYRLYTVDMFALLIGPIKLYNQGGICTRELVIRGRYFELYHSKYYN